MGRIHPIKNQLTTIRAVAKVPGITFAIAGPVTDEKYKLLLDEEIQKLSVSDRVRFLGVVDGIDKYYLLRHSLANTHMASWESYCNAVHESMSQGCVCIVAKDTALEELIKDGVNGYAVSVEDASAVAEKYDTYSNRKEAMIFWRCENEISLLRRGIRGMILRKG